MQCDLIKTLLNQGILPITKQVILEMELLE